MPLAGFICCQTGEPSGCGSCLAMARSGECAYPLPLLSTMAAHKESRNGLGISSTDVSGCPRQYVLKNRFDFYESPEDYCARFRGSGLHSQMESAGPYHGVLQEERFFGTISGVPISGMPDWVDITNKEILDWKTCSAIPREAYDSHILQLNIYAELLHQSNIEVDKGAVWYFDGRKFRRRTIPIWQGRERTERLETAVHPFLQTLRSDSEIPDRIPEYPNHFLCKYCPVKDHCDTL